MIRSASGRLASRCQMREGSWPVASFQARHTSCSRLEPGKMMTTAFIGGRWRWRDEPHIRRAGPAFKRTRGRPITDGRWRAALFWRVQDDAARGAEKKQRMRTERRVQDAQGEEEHADAPQQRRASC